MKIIEFGTPLREKTVVALGFFDSIHIGHRDIINKAVEKAKATGAMSLIFTFSNNPADFFGSKGKIIYTFEERCNIIEDLGVDAIVFARFGETFRDMSPLAFMNILSLLNPVSVVCGFDYSFGKNAEGTPEMLQKFFLPKNIAVEVVDEIKDECGKIGTTRIKGLLAEGNILKATSFLGEAYRIEGIVSHGYGVGGSRLGFPTANIELSNEKFLLKCGVYAGRARVGKKNFYCIINYGCRPTFDDDAIKVEAFLIDFDGDIYGEKITLFFDEYLRETKKFDTVDLLKSQIKADMEKVQRRKND